MDLMTARAIAADLREVRQSTHLSLDEAEFRAFYDQTATALRGYLRRSLHTDAVDDAVQEAYLRLLRTPHAALPQDERRAYLYRIATNLVTDQWRLRKTRGNGDASPTPDDLPARVAPPGQQIDMHRALGRLRVQERTMLWLAYVEQASHREIAAALEVKEGSVRVLLSRARRKLAGLLGLQPLRRTP
ncbi:MAG: RNA polymerase sigma factor [Acidobacteria bacterium]|nr:RNA polymerase sigma factor [Acidobacteriota bacterium]